MGPLGRAGQPPFPSVAGERGGGSGRSIGRAQCALGNPRGNPTGRQGKAKVKLMMIVQIMMNMYMETT